MRGFVYNLFYIVNKKSLSLLKQHPCLSIYKTLAKTVLNKDYLFFILKGSLPAAGGYE